MSKPATGKTHPQPDLLLAFCERMAREIGRHYVARTAEFIQINYPGSVDTLIPKLRVIYRNNPPK